MERKSSIKDVHKCITQDYPELYKTLVSKLGENNPFAKFSIGAGAYVWSDNRCHWLRMIDASELKQSFVRESIDHTKADVATIIGAKTAGALFTIPDDSYIYYNEDGGDVRILIAGWGFKKPVRVTSGPETAQIRQKNPVSISFSYDGDRLKNYAFGLRLAKQVKRLSTDGSGLCSFGDLKVGENYIVVDFKNGGDYQLNIIEGQSVYNFDVTQYSQLDIFAVSDDQPLHGEKVEVLYHGNQYEATTDKEGHATIKLPFYENESATATMREKTESTCMSDTGGQIQFVFQSDTPVIPDKKIEEIFNPYVLVKKENGDFVDNYPIKVEYNDDTTDYMSDAEGKVKLSNLEVGKSMKVIDGNNPENVAEYVLDSEQQEYVFIIPDVHDDRRDVKVMFRDMKGNPIVCNNVVFRQADALEQTKQLDANGDTYLKPGDFKVGTTISACINGWSNAEQYSPIPFTLEEDEYEYLLQEKESTTKSSWWEIILEILAVLVSIVLLLVLWPLFEVFCEEMFESIYL